MRKQPIIHSKYNSKENFSFEDMPGEFKSVTQQSINDIKDYCAHTIANKFKGSYDAGSLYFMIGVVMGNFDLLTSQLIEDYGSRRSKMKKAQSLGLKQVGQMLEEFKHDVAQYEVILNDYSEAIAIYGGRPLDDDLHYRSNKLVELENKLNKVMEKNNEA